MSFGNGTETKILIEFLRRFYILKLAVICWWQYDNGWWQYDNGWWQYDNGWWQYDNSWWQYDNGWWQYDNGWWQYDNGWWQYDNGWWQYDNGLEIVETANNKFKLNQQNYLFFSKIFFL
jgi:hypothetical protein